MDDLDRQLVMLLGEGISLQTRPFEAIAKKLGTDEASILLRISRLRQDKVIGPLAAVLDARKLGYRSTLVAMQIPAWLLDEKAALASEHPGVHHSCGRKHEFNLWLTLVVPPGDSVEAYVQSLHEIAGSRKTLILPALKRYKSDSEQRWEYFRERKRSPESELVRDTAVQEEPLLTAEEKEVVQSLQNDLRVTDMPFRRLAQRIGFTEEKLFGIIRSIMNRGYLRRIGTVFHRRPEECSSVLTVWRIPEEKQEVLSYQMALFQEVGQCTLRPAYPEFNYSIYANIRTRDFSSWEEVAERIARKIGRWPREGLRMTKEFKQGPVRCSSKDLDPWKAGQNRSPGEYAANTIRLRTMRSQRT